MYTWVHTHFLYVQHFVVLYVDRPSHVWNGLKRELTDEWLVFIVVFTPSACEVCFHIINLPPQRYFYVFFFLIHRKSTQFQLLVCRLQYTKFHSHMDFPPLYHGTNKPNLSKQYVEVTALNSHWLLSANTVCARTVKLLVLGSNWFAPVCKLFQSPATVLIFLVIFLLLTTDFHCGHCFFQPEICQSSILPKTSARSGRLPLDVTSRTNTLSLSFGT